MWRLIVLKILKESWHLESQLKPLKLMGLRSRKAGCATTAQSRQADRVSISDCTCMAFPSWRLGQESVYREAWEQLAAGKVSAEYRKD